MNFVTEIKPQTVYAMQTGEVAERLAAARALMWHVGYDGPVRKKERSFFLAKISCSFKPSISDRTFFIYPIIRNSTHSNAEKPLTHKDHSDTLRGDKDLSTEWQWLWQSDLQPLLNYPFLHLHRLPRLLKLTPRKLS